jgi:phosphoserine phosphatase
LPSDHQGKAAFMRQVIEEHGISPSECVFVGDGMNDVYLAREVGISISFNGQHQLKSVATYHIEQTQHKENLASIISLF